jgi:Wiskott-Aldrich syndrome protein
MPVNLNNDSAAEKPSGPRLPVVPDTRNALMESIRKGAQLKKVDVSSNASNSSGDSRNDLMSEIRGGIELRPVSDRPTANRSSGDGAGTDALANALRRALELRNKAVNGASSSEESENSDDGEWSD